MTNFEQNNELKEQSHLLDPQGNPSHGKMGKSPPGLSKAWSIKAAHMPIYTGGKISPYFLTLPEKHGDNYDDEMVNDGEVEEGRTIPCLLLPVSGDVAIVDAQRGVKLMSIRGNNPVNSASSDDDNRIDEEAITAYALSPNQNCIITCSQNQLLQQYIFHVKWANGSRTNNMSASLQKCWGRSGHSLPVTNMEFHKSGVFVGTASGDGSVRIWDARGGHVTHIFRPLACGSGGGGGRQSVTSIRWLPSIMHLVIAIGRDDGSIAIHDLRDKGMLDVVVLRDHMSAITSMEWWWQGGDEKSLGVYPAMFVTVGRDAVLSIWQIVESEKDDGSKEEKKKMKSKQRANCPLPKPPAYRIIQTLPVYEQIEGMVVLPNLNDEGSFYVVTAGNKGVVRMWEAKQIAFGHMSALSLYAEQPPSQGYGENRGGYLGLYSIPTPLAEYSADKRVASMRLQQLIVSDADHNLSFLSAVLTTDDKLATNRTIVGFNDEILDLKIIPTLEPECQSSHIVVATNSAQVRIFSLDSFSCHVLDHHTEIVLCVDVSPCGRYIATCGKDKKMCLWHTESRKCVATAVGHTEAIGATALSKQVGRYEMCGKTARNGAGSFVVTASLDRTLKRWNLPGNAHFDACAKVEAGEAISLDTFVSVRAHEKDINVVSIAPNDSFVATGSLDKTVKLWSATDLNLMATFKGHRRGVWDCQFSPFDRVLATGSGDRSIRLWSLSDYSCVRTFQGHVSSVLRVRFLSGGLQLVSSGADGLVKLWTIRTNECEATMDGHSDKVWALDVSPLGTTMISGSADSHLLVWKDTTDEAESEKRAQCEEAILMDQQLANHLIHKEFPKALDVALMLDKPRFSLKVLTSIIETDVKEKHNPLYSLQMYIPTWSIDRIAQVLHYCREWNVGARNCDVAMLVIQAILSVLPAEELAAAIGIPEILSGVVPYAGCHFGRLDRLCTSAYIFDFALLSPGSLEDTSDVFWDCQGKLFRPPVHAEGENHLRGRADVVRGTHAQLEQEEVSV